VEGREFKQHGALFSLDFFNPEWFGVGLFSVKYFPNKKSFLIVLFNNTDKNNSGEMTTIMIKIIIIVMKKKL
jgi:hypothetical protein